MTFYSRRLAYWRNRTGITADVRPLEVGRCPRYLGRVLRLKAYATRHRVEALERSLLAKWRCIHEHEGAWNSATGNGYYGGLQMDVSFMTSHGLDFLRRFGYAHHWPVVTQLIVAERAYDAGRGFGPWPNTRRICGV